MVFGIIGENCTGKSTLAEEIKTEFDYRFDGAKGDAKAFCEVLKRGKCG